MYLKGVSNINRPNITENIRDSIITFLDWGFLNAGGYFNVEIQPTGNAHVLRPVNDPRYSTGQVWQAYRGNWVWESGIAQSTQPIDVSGVFINNIFYANNNGYYIDYINGRVILDTPITTSSVVKAAYSFKWINVTDSRSIPWFRQTQADSFNYNNTNFPVGSGIYNQLSDTLIQLPTIAIEIPMLNQQKPFEIGGNANWFNTELILHVISEDDGVANRLSDALISQKDKTIYVFDSELLGENDAFPLNYLGAKNVNPRTYPQLIGESGYKYTSRIKDGKLRINDAFVSGGSWISSRTFHKTVRWSVESILLF